MGRDIQPLLVVAALAAGVVLLGLGTVGGPVGTAEAPERPGGVVGALELSETGSDEAGEHLAGLAATQDRLLRGAVERESFAERLDEASSTDQQAALLDETLSDIDERLRTHEQRLGDNDTTAVGTGEVADIGADARALDALLDDISAGIDELPATVRAEWNLTARLGVHRERVATLRERTRDVTRFVDGVGQDVRATPVDVADIERAVERTLGLSQVDRFFGSERIDLHVRQHDGETLRVGVETDDGAVAAIEESGHDEPTVRVYTDYRVVRTVGHTDDAGEAVRDALAADRIRYDGQGLRNSFRYGTARILEWLGT